MKKNVSIAIAVLSILAVVFALAFPAQIHVQAQEADPDPSSNLALGNAPVGVAAPTTLAIPVQGRLTTSNGAPVNGSRTITMRMYTGSSSGVAICEDTDTVPVVNGLWSTYMDWCTAANINGQQLYLGIQVTGEAAEMTPRQPILPSPMAYTLVDGANIGAIKSSATTYVYASPQKAVAPGGSNLTLTHYSDGYLVVKANNSGTHWVYIPVDLPGLLFGTSFKFTNLRICYDLTAASSFISETNFRILNDNLTSLDAVTDLTDRTSITPICYVVTNGTNEIIDGSAMVRLTLYFANTTDTIRIGNIRITLNQ